MASTNLVDMDSAMKVIFEDSIYDNFVTDSEADDWFQADGNIKTEETTGGRYIETAQYFGLPAGFRAVAAGDYIPVPNGPSIENSRIYLKKGQGVVEMQGDVMRRVRTNEGAFLDWGKRALPDLVTRMANTVDRMILGYGQGILARIDEADPTTDAVFRVDSAYGVAGWGPTHRLFAPGEQIVFSAAADGDPLKNPSAPMAIVNESERDGNGALLTVTMAAGLQSALANNDYIFLGDNTQQAIPTAAGASREWMGLAGMIDDGDILAEFQEIARASYPLWRGQVIDAATQPGASAGIFNEDLLALADEQTALEGGGKVTKILASYPAVRQYWRTLRSDRTINDPRGTYDGGMKGVSIRLGTRKIELRSARKLPDQVAYGIQPNTFKKFTLGRYEWDDTTGSIWNRATDSVGRRDQYYAVGNVYCEYACFAPAKNWRIEGIDVTADIADDS